ncbi:MAG: hypothetical protein NWF00_06945 [Candidatus Bathyarchaeota archaeon]|nr:hypothetical protein [Candidatus Bathyarchaeota archaeon]
MVKTAVITPLYLSVAWTLMVSYQLFTETAVTSVLAQVNVFFPSASVWLAARTDMIIFIYAFAWVFLLSSVIPSAILGKERSVIAQFIVCLTLTLSAFILLDALESLAGNPLGQLLGYSFLFTNPIIAALYLAVPYIFMIGIDLRARSIRKREEERLAEIEENKLQSASPFEENSQEAELQY